MITAGSRASSWSLSSLVRPLLATEICLVPTSAADTADPPVPLPPVPPLRAPRRPRSPVESALALLTGGDPDSPCRRRRGRGTPVGDGLSAEDRLYLSGVSGGCPGSVSPPSEPTTGSSVPDPPSESESRMMTLEEPAEGLELEAGGERVVLLK